MGPLDMYICYRDHLVGALQKLEVLKTRVWVVVGGSKIGNRLYQQFWMAVECTGNAPRPSIVLFMATQPPTERLRIYVVPPWSFLTQTRIRTLIFHTNSQLFPTNSYRQPSNSEEYWGTTITVGPSGVMTSENWEKETKLD